MKVQDADILSDVTEKTSRNLKAVAAATIAVKWFNVKLDDLRVLGVELPANLFDIAAVTIIVYMMIILVFSWRVDYLLWRNGPILATKKNIQRYIDDLITIMEHHPARSRSADVTVSDATNRGKDIVDNFLALKVEVLDFRRSLSATTWWVYVVIFGLHLGLPLVLGIFSMWMVIGAWACYAVPMWCTAAGGVT